MVVDDEASMRGLLRDFFTSLGYRVTSCATGGAALKILHNREITVAALIADIRMNPMDGIALLKRLRVEFPLLPVVLFTSAGSPEGRDEALLLGALHDLTKPFSLTELRAVIERAIAPPGRLKQS